MLLSVAGLANFPRSSVDTNCAPINNYSAERSPEYDSGRIVYFRNCFINNIPVDPLHVLVWEYNVILVDGYHRLAGAVLAGITHIDVEKIKAP